MKALKSAPAVDADFLSLDKRRKDDFKILEGLVVKLHLNSMPSLTSSSSR